MTAEDNVYLAIGANGTVAGRLQIPKGSPVLPAKDLMSERSISS